ncbi:MAG TPA: DUF348 domain-containing protein [Chloroflexi bacterium]|nr:DUF348 domain-containing protein [Chloroflexota bacterium]
MGKISCIFLLLSLLPLLLAACVPMAPAGAQTVRLLVDGETRTITTEARTVRQLLAEANVTLDEDDYVSPAETTFLEAGLLVQVRRVEVWTEIEQREIPFERRTVRDASIPAGETRLLEPGISGIEELAYRVTLEDGVEVDRRQVRRVMIRNPRAEVILIGVQPERGPTPISGTVAYLANHNAWVIQTTSANQRRLTHESDLDGRVFSLSRDGAYLLFTRVPTETGGGASSGASSGAPFNELWAIETATAGAEPIRLGIENVLWAAWEPNCRVDPETVGCRVAYSTGAPADGNPPWKAENDLWVVRVPFRDEQAARPRIILGPSAGGSYGWWGMTYAWSPDGGSLAYARADEVGIIQIVDAQRRALARFAPYRTYAAWVWTPSVSWSPEGNFVVTTLHGPAPTGQAPEDSPVFDVWVLSANGVITAKLSSEAGMWAAPQYAPEGSLIVFGRARSPYVSHTSGYELYVMDRDGSDRRHLFPPAEEPGLNYPELAWGPGGQRLIVVYQGNLYLLSVAGDDVGQLTDEGSVSAVRWGW